MLEVSLNARERSIFDSHNIVLATKGIALKIKSILKVIFPLLLKLMSFSYIISYKMLTAHINTKQRTTITTDISKSGQHTVYFLS